MGLSLTDSVKEQVPEKAKTSGSLLLSMVKHTVANY